MTSPTRPFEARLAYPAADRHRPAAPGCGPESQALLYDHQNLAELERIGDRHGLASVYALSCDPRRARRLLQELPLAPDVQNDLAALSIDTPQTEAQVLRRLDEVLQSQPRHPQALWNRGLVLAGLALPLAAARSFRAVAALGEPGWSQEAAERASALEQSAARLLQAEAQAETALAGIAKGVAPESEVIARYPEAARLALFAAIRTRPGDAARALLPVAQAIDKVQGGTALTQMASGAVDLNRMMALTQEPVDLDKAHAYQRLAAVTGDPWQEIRGWQLLGRAESAERHFEPALRAFNQALTLCQRRPFPEVCTATKGWLSRHHSDRYQLQPARAYALEAKRDSQTHVLVWGELQANDRLQRIEDFRQEFGLARAYAEENSLHGENCKVAQAALEYLAETAMQQGQLAQARQHLAEVRPCGTPAANQPRFDLIGLSVLGALVRDPRNQGDELRWWNESLAWHRAQWDQRAPFEQTTILLVEGRAMIEREPARAQALLHEVIKRSEARGPGDAGAETKRLEAFATLLVFATARGEHQAAFDLLAQALRVTPGQGCVVGAVAESNHRAYLARGRAGALVGLHEVVTAEDDPDAALPGSIQQAVAGCEKVDVMATGRFFGRARLLPEHIAWGFLARGNSAAQPKRQYQRLIVSDVDVPAALDLPPLAHPLAPAPAPDETIVPLTGREATPDEVLRRMSAVDVIELHVHGMLDRSVSDAPALVLSPNAAGVSLLGAREIEGLRLPRRPGVILGACDVGSSARYWSYRHSLPAAFIQAGADWVLASPAPVEDSEASPFFDRVWQRTRQGALLAVALRDERQSPRWAAAQSDWIRHVVAFY